MANFERYAASVDTLQILQEVDAYPEHWYVNTNRQKTIAVQRHTEAVFIRSAQMTGNPGERLEDILCTEWTPLAAHYPATQRFLNEFAARNDTPLGRAMLVRLKPRTTVLRHKDHGVYYQAHDRFHLILRSSTGSVMYCAGEKIRAAEGEVWWFDNKKLHESANESDEWRTHLIFDLACPGRREAR
jgi:Aspartyl/Asparaginyl beta-hydroxylase